MLQQRPKRRRCVVLKDGTAIGCYQHNTHETHIVVLEPSGHTYTYIRPDGTRTRHLTPTVLSSLRPLVIDILHLRNRFTAKSPYLHARLISTKDLRYQRRIRAPRAWWPATEGKIQVSRLYNSKEKRFEMQSIEGAAKVQLHASGKVVELYYVAEVKVLDSDGEDEKSHAHYTTLHQSFAVTQTQTSFGFPVDFFIAAKEAWDKDQEAEIEYVRDEKNVSKQGSPLPGNGAFSARPAFSVIATGKDGVQLYGKEENFLTLAEILRVATLPSKTLYLHVVAEMVGEDATLFVSHRPNNFLPEIVVQVECEQSLLTGCDGFFTSYDEAGQPQHRFTRETIPPSSTIDTTRAL